MDFVNRNPQNQQQSGRVTSPSESVDLSTARVRSEEKHNHNGKHDMFTKWSRLGSGVLLVIGALLVATLAWLIYTTSPTSENSYVDPSKLQAVFLNTGQVYFGNIQTLNQQYVVLTNVYYLQSNSSTSSTSSSTANQNVTLVKLGCELHMPYDRMIINNTEVTFWENLQPTGQVAEAVASYEKAHPNGKQTCSQQSQTQSTSNPQNATSSSK
jgi:hypothetical protein